MGILNSICFVYLNDMNNLKTVFHEENDIFIEVKYAIPVCLLMISESEDLVYYIYSSYQTTLRSFYTFKKKCLENYSFSEKSTFQEHFVKRHDLKCVCNLFCT